MIHKELYIYWEKQKNWEKAFKQLSEYKIYSDSVNKENNKNKLYELKAKYNIAEKEKKIDQLKNANLNRKYELYILISILTILILGVFIYYKNIKEKIEKNKILNDLKTEELINKLTLVENNLVQEIQSKNIEKNKTISNQRNEISKVIHDEISNSLAALQFYISDLKTNAKNLELQNALNLLEDETKAIYAHTRNLMNSLRNENMTHEQNIVAFLETLELKFNSDSKMSINIESNNDEIENSLNPKHQTELYFIIKEAITNAIKHSNATKVFIEVKIRNKSCYFSILDNGKGINLSENKTGMGIENMKNRIKDLSGEIDISSKKTGSNIIGHFPIAD